MAKDFISLGDVAAGDDGHPLRALRAAQASLCCAAGR